MAIGTIAGTGVIQVVLAELVLRIHDLLGNKVKKIVVYGSYARGDAHKDSDMDIMVMVNADSEQLRQYRSCVLDIQVDLSLEYEIVISIMLQSMDEYNKWLPVLPFFQNVEREGVDICGNNEARFIPISL